MPYQFTCNKAHLLWLHSVHRGEEAELAPARLLLPSLVGAGANAGQNMHKDQLRFFDFSLFILHVLKRLERVVRALQYLSSIQHAF